MNRFNYLNYPLFKLFWQFFNFIIKFTIYLNVKQVMENCKQYKSPLPVGTLVVIATKFIGLSTKISDMHYLQIKVSKDPVFTVSTSIATSLK